MPKNRISNSIIPSYDSNTAPAFNDVSLQDVMPFTGALQNAILKSSNCSVIATDAQGFIQIFNAGAERMLGYTASDILNKVTPADIADPHEIIRRAQAVSQELAAMVNPGFEALVVKARLGIEDNFELTYIRKDGSRLPVIISVTTLSDEQNTIIGYFLVNSDNSSRKKIEDDLLESEQFSQTTLDAISAEIAILDETGSILVVNRAWRDLAQSEAPLTAEICEGANYLAVCDSTCGPDAVFATAIAAGIRAAISGENGFFSLEYPCDSVENSLIVKRWFNATVTRSTGEGPIRIVVVHENITERKQVENALHENAAFLNTLLESMPVPVFYKDTEGRYVGLNKAFEVLMGKTRAELIGNSIFDITPIELAEIYQTKDIELFQDTGVQVYDATLKDAAGQIHDVLFHKAVYRDAGGDVIGLIGVILDISARKRAEDTILKSKDMLQAIVDNMPTRIFWKDRDSHFLGCNEKFAQDAGYSRPIELIGKTDFEIHWKEQAKSYREDDEAVMATGIPKLNYEESQTKPDGNKLWLKSSKVPLRNEKNQVIGVLGIYEDFTEHKEAEEALIEAGALQSAIFNSANFSSIATDARGVIQIFNVGAERMLGYTTAEVLNKITPADISDPQEVIARARDLSIELSSPIAPGFEALVFKASRGIEDIYELTYIRKDGSRFPAVVSVTALRDAQDAIIGYLLIGTDNTARKQIEAEQQQLGQRLRDQQFYTRSLFESNIDALITTDPSGIITDVNKQMEALTDCTRDELIGAPFKQYFTEPEQAEACIKLVLNQKKVSNYQLTARTRDNRETVVSYNATTIYDRDRKLQGVFAAARDVTERNRLDQVLQEKNVELESARSIAEKANLAKSEFLSSMSHELRSPLNAILGFAQLMEFDSPPPTPIQLQSIDQISQAGWHLLKLINEILDLAKIESGQEQVSQEPVSMTEVLIECQDMLEPLSQQRDIKLTLPSVDTPYFVNADRTRLKQIIINLLSNAIKYNSEQGTVDVVCSENTPGRIRMSIGDSGPGLTAEEIKHLFQAFNRLGQEGNGTEGTGIGLVVAKRLVELMGGLIGVESIIGVGSVFWFELLSTVQPRLSTEDIDLKHSEVQKYLQHTTALHTLLYVEDNPANQKLIEQIIARQPNLRLLTSVNGKSGIKIARSSLPDVILLDINLPDINGLSVLNILRTDPATSHIPIIALSANAMPRDIQKGLDAGFFHYITKPIKINAFMDTLADALEFAEKQLKSNQVI